MIRDTILFSDLGCAIIFCFYGLDLSGVGALSGKHGPRKMCDTYFSFFSCKASALDCIYQRAMLIWYIFLYQIEPSKTERQFWPRFLRLECCSSFLEFADVFPFLASGSTITSTVWQYSVRGAEYFEGEKWVKYIFEASMQWCCNSLFGSLYIILQNTS